MNLLLNVRADPTYVNKQNSNLLSKNMPVEQPFIAHAPLLDVTDSVIHIC